MTTLLKELASVLFQTVVIVGMPIALLAFAYCYDATHADTHTDTDE